MVPHDERNVGGGGVRPRRQGQHPADSSLVTIGTHGAWAAPSDMGQGIEWAADRCVWVTVLAI
jgi:hypothetical protein